MGCFYDEISLGCHSQVDLKHELQSFYVQYNPDFYWQPIFVEKETHILNDLELT